MTQTEVWTIGKLLSWTSEFLKKHGSDSPRLDAEVLLAHAKGCRRIELYTAFESEPDQATKTAFREMVKRRSEGSPVAYLVGSKEFYSLSFIVNSDCLIPRPETEHLVLAGLDLAKIRRAATGRRLEVADLCTGSGCVAIAFAKQFADASLTAVDIVPATLDLAKRNVAQHGLEDRISLLQGDLLEGLPEAVKFDLILSNPPYISQAEFEKLDRSVRQFEPEVALLAGANGTEIIAKIEAQAYDRLLEQGSVLIEMSPSIADQVREIFADEKRWSNVRILKDLAGHQRVLQATKCLSKTI